MQIENGKLINVTNHDLNADGSFFVPEEITEINSWAFSDINVTSVTMHDGITFIGKWCFRNCNQLKSISIPPKVVELPDGVFSGCEYLERVSLTNVQKVRSDTFNYCRSLKSISCNDPNIDCSSSFPNNQIFDLKVKDEKEYKALFSRDLKGFIVADGYVMLNQNEEILDMGAHPEYPLYYGRKLTKSLFEGRAYKTQTYYFTIVNGKVICCDNIKEAYNAVRYAFMPF